MVSEAAESYRALRWPETAIPMQRLKKRTIVIDETGVRLCIWGQVKSALGTSK